MNLVTISFTSELPEQDLI